VSIIDARVAKAIRLADVLRAHQTTAAEARALPEETWVTIADLAGVRLPSAETRAVVVTILGVAERHPDPFEGL
jgi:hypothetical protein